MKQQVVCKELTSYGSARSHQIRTVSSFCAEKRVMIKYIQKCQGSKNQGIRTGIVGGLGFGFSNMMLYFTAALCYYVGAKFVSQGKSNFGNVFKALFSLVLTVVGAAQTSAMASDSTKAKDSATSIFTILDRKSQIDSSSEEGSTTVDVKGDIDFMHISFIYPSRPDIQIFSDFNLIIPSRKTVALVGQSGSRKSTVRERVIHVPLPISLSSRCSTAIRLCSLVPRLVFSLSSASQSGSRKSTVIALLERFYDPDSGVILLDGVEIKNLKLSWLRDQMGLVEN